MRSATNNRFINVWQYEYSSSDGCDVSNNVFTLAEVAAQQTSGATATSPLGSYFWPITDFYVLGPTKRNIDATDGTASCTPSGTPTSVTQLEIFCGTIPGACVQVEKLSGCDPDDWNLKFGIQWEESTNDGLTWFRLPDTSRNLVSNKIAIGVASPATGPAVTGYASRATPPNYFEDANSDVIAKTQFYGVIDSIRISRGVARYIDPVCQPYNPHDTAERLIDKYVIFALNIGTNTYQIPGGKIFPYYLHNRGWLVPGQPLYPGNSEILATEIRNVLAHSSTQIDTDPANLGDADLDFYDAHKLLCYSTRDAGYKGRCGISFPSTLKAHDAAELAPAGMENIEFAQGLFLEDAIVPPPANRTREIFVDAAATENLVTDFAGRIWGNQRVIDGKKNYSNSANAADANSENKTFLVPAQTNPEENGIYKITFQSVETGYLWERIINLTTSAPDTFANARIFVTDGTSRMATVWYCTTTNFVFGDDPIQFEQEKTLGLYREDFCVEAYFKVGGFLHPNGFDTRAGENMTLIDTYYGDPHDTASDGEGGTTTTRNSGLRIYFRPVENQHTGQVLVDIGPYVTAVETAVPAISGPLEGPALRSKTIKANVFYHVAVTRHRDVFRLYVDGVLQDQFISQDTTYVPGNRTAEQNDILYRARGFFGTRWSKTTAPAQFLVRQSEFYFDPDASGGGTAYAMRFNGSAGMIKTSNTSRQFLNLAGYHPNPDWSAFLSFPGAPIPDYPADSHVYIYNVVEIDDGVETNVLLSFVPNLRFPRQTTYVDLATTPSEATYKNVENATVPIPNSGNINPYGLYKQGKPAQGVMRLWFSTSANRFVPKMARFTANGVTFRPNIPITSTNPSQAPTGFNIVTAGASLTTDILLQVDDTTPPIDDITPPNYFALIPVIAVQNSTAGNIAAGTTMLVENNFGSVRAASTANVAVLSGLLTIDGVTLAVGERVLLKNQINKATNGIYVVASGTWSRTPSLSTSEQVVAGASVRVTAGTANAGKMFYISNTGAITLGTNDLEWAQYLTNFTEAEANITFYEGLDDYSDQDLLLDGVKVENGARILVKNQSDPATNGIYIAGPAAWARAADLDSSAELREPLRVFIKGGRTQSNAAYNKSFTGAVPDTIPARVLLGITPFTFVEDSTATGATNIVAAVETGECAGVGLTVSNEPSVRVTCVTTGNIPGLSGIPSPALTDNYQTTAAPASVVFVRAQTNPAENGIYFVSNGPWRRVRYLKKTEHFVNNLIVAPLEGTSAGVQTAAWVPRYAYRMLIPENFELGLSPITSTQTTETLTQLHLPYNFRTLGVTGIELDTGTGEPKLSPGDELSFEDFIGAGPGEEPLDMKVWRLKFKCGDTIAYSRNVIVRMASKLTTNGKPVDEKGPEDVAIDDSQLLTAKLIVRSTNTST